MEFQQAPPAGPNGFRNLLINPYGAINQRAAASSADDTYANDRWNVLVETAAVAASTLTDQENGTPFMWRLTQSQASAQRMGMSQIIEGANCKHLRGKTVTLSGRVRRTTAAAIRYAILEWTGSMDTVTSDVVNSWTNATFTAGNFFISTTLTVSAVGAITPAANTLTDLTPLSVTLGSTFTNLIVFVWTETTAAQNAVLDGAIQFEEGGSATLREARPYPVELEMCQRYYNTSYLGVAVGTATSTNAIANINESASNNYPALGWSSFPVEMRAAPTMVLYSTSTGATGVIRDMTGSADRAAAFALGSPATKGFTAHVNNVAVAGNSTLSAHYTASAEL